jgi:2-polyprenyl-3-methyl-5-hydroxy-6-metoxy-1,4-benzoquinol methylase
MKSAPYSPSLDEQQQYWDRRWDRTRNPNEWSFRRAEAITRFLRSLRLECPKILDLGCGTGWFADQLSYLGTVTGIDLSETAISLARVQFPQATFIAGDLYELPLPAETFDVVVSQEVIAHVPNQVALLDRIHHVLKPEGYLVVTTVNKFVIERMYHPPDPPAHIKQWLDMRALQHLLCPRFRVLRTTSVLPMGHKGLLKVINSTKVNTALGLLIPKPYLESLKEWAGFGYTLIVLAQKRY